MVPYHISFGINFIASKIHPWLAFEKGVALLENTHGQSHPPFKHGTQHPSISSGAHFNFRKGVCQHRSNGGDFSSLFFVRFGPLDFSSSRPFSWCMHALVCGFSDLKELSYIDRKLDGYRTRFSPKLERDRDGERIFFSPKRFNSVLHLEGTPKECLFSTTTAGKIRDDVPWKLSRSILGTLSDGPLRTQSTW